MNNDDIRLKKLRMNREYARFMIRSFKEHQQNDVSRTIQNNVEPVDVKVERLKENQNYKIVSTPPVKNTANNTDKNIRTTISPTKDQSKDQSKDQPKVIEVKRNIPIISNQSHCPDNKSDEKFPDEKFPDEKFIEPINIKRSWWSPKIPV